MRYQVLTAREVIFALEPPQWGKECALCGKGIKLQQYYQMIVSRRKDACELTGEEITRIQFVHAHDDCVNNAIKGS